MNVKNHTKTRLKEHVIKLIKADAMLTAMLAEHFRVSIYTIQRWLRNNDPYLCFTESIAIIERQLGEKEITEQVIIEREGVEL